MRNFTDSAGVEWTVFEIKRQGNDEENWGYLPHGFRAGWLCFESLSGKRRLSPVPDGWKSFESPDLEKMLRRAAPVIRGKKDLSTDDTSFGETMDGDADVRP